MQVALPRELSAPRIRGREAGRGEPRKQPGNRAGILVELRKRCRAEMPLPTGSSAHRCQKQDQQQHTQQPPPSGHRKPEGNPHRAQIKRVARVSVGPGARKFSILFDIARRVSRAARPPEAPAPGSSQRLPARAGKDRNTAATTNPSGTRMRRATFCQRVLPVAPHGALRDLSTGQANLPHPAMRSQITAR